MDDIFNLLRELTTEEKAALVAGTDFMFTNPVPRLDIPQIRMSDGPHGLRVQNSGGTREQRIFRKILEVSAGKRISLDVYAWT